MSYVSGPAASAASARLMPTREDITDVWKVDIDSVVRRNYVVRLVSGELKCSEHLEGKCNCVRKVVSYMNEPIEDRAWTTFTYDIVAHHQLKKNPHPFPTLEEFDKANSAEVKKVVKQHPKGRKINL